MLEDPVRYYLEGWACLCLGSVGFVINSYAIWTLVFRQKHTAIFHKLMLALVVYDLFYVLLSCLTYSLRMISPYYRGENGYIGLFAWPFLGLFSIRLMKLTTHESSRVLFIFWNKLFSNDM